ncbi:MAG: dihydrolipoyl dehydrogenase [Actinomycetota bacterium]
MDRYEIAIIGSGPAGYVGAIKAARAGVPTCIIEKGEFGGVCLNIGCIPTKAMVASAKMLRNARRSSEFSVKIDGAISASLEDFYRRKDRIVEVEKKGLINLVESSGAVIKKGHASFLDNNTIKITSDGSEEIIHAKNIVIATGSKPAALPFLPFDGVKVLSSDNMLNLDKLPKSLLVIGGGYIGCEFASIFSALGTKVTIVEALPHILPNMDGDIAKVLDREFRKEKIEIHTNSKIVGAKISDVVTITLEDGTDISAEMALVSIGRRALIDGLGLENTGVSMLPQGIIKVNNQMRTNVPNIFAVGDVIGNPMLAHVASAECKVAIANALGNHFIMDYSVIPSGVFTYPEIGSVGLTENAARQMGMDVKVGSIQLRKIGISHASGEIIGLAKIVTDAISDKIVGAHIIGERATDLIHEIAAAMFQGMTSSMLGRMIHSHPSFSEVIAEAAQDVSGEAIYETRKAA